MNSAYAIIYESNQQWGTRYIKFRVLHYVTDFIFTVFGIFPFFFFFGVCLD
jgi:hypothetical protein